MSGIWNTGSSPKLLWPGIKEIYGLVYNRYDGEYKELFEIISSDKRYEETQSLSGLGLATILYEGAPTDVATATNGFTTRFAMVQYGLSYQITKLAMADNQYALSLSEEFSKSLALSMQQTKEVVAANVLNTAFSSTIYQIGGDRKALCAVDHPLAGNPLTVSTYANRPTNASGTAADMDLSEAGLEQAEIDIEGFVDDAGIKIQAQARKLVIPRNLKYEAERILHSPARVGTADNDLNAISKTSTIPEGYTINHFLTSSKNWFLLTNVPNGLVMFEREGYELEMHNDFLTSNLLVKASERYAVGYRNARAIYGSNAP